MLNQNEQHKMIFIEVPFESYFEKLGYTVKVTDVTQLIPYDELCICLPVFEGSDWKFAKFAGYTLQFAIVKNISKSGNLTLYKLDDLDAESPSVANEIGAKTIKATTMLSRTAFKLACYRRDMGNSREEV